MPSELDAINAIPARMNDAWNAGDATAFAAGFAQDAEFVAFEGTVLKGRDGIVAFHQPLFDTLLKGSRLVAREGGFTRILEPGWAVVHHRIGVIMPGDDAPLASRDSMQLFVVRWQNDRWEVVAMQNSRIVSLEGQQALDELAAAARG